MESLEEAGRAIPASWSQRLAPYRVPVALGGVSVLLISIALVLLAKSVQNTTPIEFSRSDGGSNSILGVSDEGSASANTGRGISVDMEGAVVHPGVYRLALDSRVEDGIVAAGGLSSDVDAVAVARSINRAAKLIDGAKIYIPKVGDQTSRNINTQGNNETSHIVGSVGEAGSTVNVNSASQSELESLSGVGPVTAGKIIAGRPYMSLDQLVSKKAMSQSLFNKLKDQLSL